jgi:hypothetical protein
MFSNSKKIMKDYEGLNFYIFPTSSADNHTAG